MTWQNLVLAVCSWAFTVALAPAIVKHQPPAESSCNMTAFFLTVIALTYCTLHLWLAGCSTAVTATAWCMLAHEAHRQNADR